MDENALLLYTGVNASEHVMWNQSQTVVGDVGYGEAGRTPGRVSLEVDPQRLAARRERYRRVTRLTRLVRRQGVRRRCNHGNTASGCHV